MKSFTAFLKQHSLVVGILLIFLMTWPIDLSYSGALPFQVPFALAMLVGYGIFFAALIMTALTLGKSGVIALLKRFLIWRVGAKWYLVAFLLIPSFNLLGVVLNAALSSQPIDFSTVFAYKFFGPSANLVILILPLVLYDAVTNGEEIGWRGYVLPRLQAKHSALVSSLILGVIWGLWHLPKFMAPGNSGSFALVVVDTLAKAVFLTWLYNNTQGSLLLTTLAHASWNASSMVLPMANTVSGENMGVSIISLVLQVVAVIVITVWAGPARLSRTKAMQIEERAPIPGPTLAPLPRGA